MLESPPDPSMNAAKNTGKIEGAKAPKATS